MKQLKEEILKIKSIMGLNESEDIPYAEELPLDNENDLERGIQVCSKLLKESEIYIESMSGVVFNTVTISAIHGNYQKYVQMVKEILAFKSKIEMYYNQYFDLIDGYDREFGVGNIPQPIQRKYDTLDRMVSALDSKVQDISEIGEVLSELVDKVKHMSQYNPHLLQIKNNEIGNSNLPAVQ